MQLQKKFAGPGKDDNDEKLDDGTDLKQAAQKAKELLATAKKERLAEEAKRLEKQRQAEKERQRRRYCCGCCY